MSDLRRWAPPLSVGPFSFRSPPPPAIVVRRPIVGPDGKPTGAVLVREPSRPFVRVEPDRQP